MLKPLAQLDQLDDKLNTLIHYVNELHNTNRELREQIKTLQTDKSQMVQRMTDAQARIDDVIAQLEIANPPVESSEAPNPSEKPL